MNRVRLPVARLLFCLLLSALYGCGSETTPASVPGGGSGNIGADGSTPAGSGGASDQGGASANGGASTRNGAGGTAVAAVSVSITPHSPIAAVGDTVSFIATVTNSTDKVVAWSVKEGASGGAITPAGVYTAPKAVGIYHVVGTSHADSTKSDTVGVDVRQPGVVITPSKTLAVTGDTAQFSATVVGSPKDTIAWTVQEGDKGGSIGNSGVYTAPPAEGTYHVVATSAADTSKSATAQVSVFGAGKWIDVTPAGVSLSPDSVLAGAGNNFGAQQVVTDSAHPGTFLVSFTYQGVWKSIDFGATWTRLTSGTDAMDNGRPSMEIAPDGSYILSTLLYPSGTFQNGCWKSVAPADASQPELGKVWRYITVPGVPNGDMGAYAVDPLDKTHAVGQSHTGTGNFYESMDSGETWAPVNVPTSTSPSRLLLVDSTTVLAVYDWGSGTNPQLGKKAGGNWTWTEVFSKDESGAAVAGQTSFHSDQQLFVDRVNQVNGKNVIYFGGPEGIQRSEDGGASWTKLSTPLKGSQGIVATAKSIYSTQAFANNTAGFDPQFMMAPRNPGTPGSTWTAPTTPAAMHNGWLKAAVATTGKHYVIVGGMWNSGLWIYIEP